MWPNQPGFFSLLADSAWHPAIIPIPCNVGGAKEPENIKRNLYKVMINKKRTNCLITKHKGQKSLFTSFCLNSAWRITFATNWNWPKQLVKINKPTNQVSKKNETCSFQLTNLHFQKKLLSWQIYTSKKTQKKWYPPKRPVGYLPFLT